MKPILKYPGGKCREIPLFEKYIPQNYDRYIEPFFGGGGVYFYLEPKDAILNDLDNRLMEFYRQVRDDYTELAEQLAALKRTYDENQENLKSTSDNHNVSSENESLYYRMRDLYNHPDGSYLTGTLCYFLNRTGFNGLMRSNQKGQFNVPFGKQKRFSTGFLTEEHSKLLRHAELYSYDYRYIFDMARADDFMFLDPPYDKTFKSYGGSGISEFGEEKHRQLAEDFKNLPCRSLMIIGKTPLTESLYTGYITDEYDNSYIIRADKNKNAVHLIVKNF